MSGKQSLAWGLAGILLVLGNVSTVAIAGAKERAQAAIKQRGIEYTPDQFLASVVDNDLALVNLFLKAGIDVNYRHPRSGNTALMLSIDTNNARLIKKLLRQGAQPNKADIAGFTPFMKLVALNDDPNLFKRFIKRGADVNHLDFYQRSPLMYAVVNQNVPAIKSLLALNADPQIEDNFGFSATVMAAQRGYLDVLSLLLAAGIDVNKVYKNNMTMLLGACMSVNTAQGDAVSLLVENKAEVNVADFNGTTPLMWQVKARGTIAQTKALLNAGAKLGSKDNVGRTALYYAISSRNLEAVNLLLDAGADVSIVDKYQTSILIHAVQINQQEMVASILQKGSNINHQDGQGWTALMHAASIGASDLVQLLKANGAELAVKNKAGQRAYDLAQNDEVKKQLTP